MLAHWHVALVKALYIDFASTSKCFYSLMLRVHGRVANTNLIVLLFFFTKTGKSPTIYTNIGEQANISQRLLYLLKKNCLMETKWLFIDVILSIDFNIHFLFVNSNVQLWLELLFLNYFTQKKWQVSLLSCDISKHNSLNCFISGSRSMKLVFMKWIGILYMKNIFTEFTYQ